MPRSSLILPDETGVIERTEGVTASFLKELLRRAAVAAAERSSGESSISVTPEDLDGALAELLDTRNRMTRSALGYADSSREKCQGSTEGDPDADWADHSTSDSYAYDLRSQVIGVGVPS